MFVTGFFAGLFGMIFAYPLLALGELFIVVMACSLFSNRRYGWTISMMIVALIAALVFSTPPRDILPFLVSHVLTFFEVVVGYILVGAIYSVARYFIFLVEVNSDLSQFCSDKGVERSAIPTRVMNDFKSKYNINTIPLRMSDFANELFVWAVYWPISGLTLVVEKPIKWVQRSAQRLMQAISNHLFGDVVVVEEPKEPVAAKPDWATMPPMNR